MNKNKKHQFKYQDPNTKPATKVSEKKEVTKPITTEETQIAIADFKKASLVIGIFIGLILLVYFFRNQLHLESLSGLLKL